ncbi:hypothetical protein [Enterobacter asburiae]|uniref:hypothetical protein n=1 Tax=Enterobacter asburiae TaxID=61645 RepID=UPI00192CD60D|nr:hypothetical protein [Enterobacter asburiae]ELN2579073.1 hypothetical protein [Enterobacter kobei]MBL5841290.1 hypothetical protein [Enterobacter asburiae]MBL5926069.1 hypothetical protein [Enterobacter asburiae]MBL5941684.1 hypothetical protein [Enterobacter asburiae]MBL5956854.1 hypothetical protein [Enterobacter asburiae]
MLFKSIVPFTLALCFSGQVLAFGNHDAWTSGFAQGAAEYTILGKGQSQLYLACDSSGSQAATIIFTDVNGHQVSMDSGQTLTLKIDDEEANISESDSHVGEGNLMWAWNKLRTGKRVIVSGTGAKPAVFTLKGAAGVIPAFGDNGCVAKFDIP